MIIKNNNIKRFKDATELKKWLQGRVFSVVFEEKNTDMRFASCDFKPRKKWLDLYGKWQINKGGGQKTNPKEYLNPFDRRNRKYINVSINRLELLRVGKKSYTARIKPVRKDLFNSKYNDNFLQLTLSS